ncbi:F-box/LRR-repeat protein [Trifolium medium]|uniref:F-box/LRR-repeat protein n=1 Tax=Trifolium medium TaxID=97028 RepID=A0A392NL55_9FABA|nr:F-box/LRR-repeat protein [Trifolium medium]
MGKLVSCSDGLEALSFSLFKLRKINLTRHHYLNDELIFQLFKNCKFLEEAITVFCPELTAGVASALRERPTLRSVALLYCNGKSSFEEACTHTLHRLYLFWNPFFVIQVSTYPAFGSSKR